MEERAALQQEQAARQPAHEDVSSKVRTEVRGCRYKCESRARAAASMGLRTRATCRSNRKALPPMDARRRNLFVAAVKTLANPSKASLPPRRSSALIMCLSRKGSVGIETRCRLRFSGTR
eukprot:6187789-Pleurochrysis_carterae.AAC.1